MLTNEMEIFKIHQSFMQKAICYMILTSSHLECQMSNSGGKLCVYIYIYIYIYIYVVKIVNLYIYILYMSQQTFKVNG